MNLGGGAAIGERVMKLREERGLSGRALALASGRSHSYIKKLERGDIESPGLDALADLAKGLELEGGVAELLGMNGASPAGADGGGLGSVQPAAPVPQDALTGRMELLEERQARIERILRGEIKPRIPELGENIRGLVGRAPEAEGDEDEEEPPERPVYLYGAAGRADDFDFLPQIHRLARPPRECLHKLAEDHYGVEIRGNSLSQLGIHDGMIAWANPVEGEGAHRGYGLGDVVVALVWNGGDSPKVYVKQYTRARGVEGLWSLGEDGREQIKTDRYKVIAKVVCVHMAPIVLD